MRDSRPNPDALLAQVTEEEAGAKRGALKIFFGYAAGVGKTYAMLENAHRVKATGRDVVAGYVEPHERPDTKALLQGFEILPVQELEYRGVRLQDFDLDAALRRRPELLLVDELAHTNAKGCRHEKRWQDVAELLDAGINVWTTLNVQHIESLNDVVGQITSVVVRETVPDHIFDMADDLELVDITPEELLVRLKAGKVYVTEQAEKAIHSFFQRGNLAALREMSLRQAARRVHTDVEIARRKISAAPPWATSERLLVCVGPSPTTARVIRAAKRMAVAFDAPWLAVSVDLTGAPTHSLINQQIADHFRLAERLGAESVTLPGQSVAGTILDYARSRNVTKIIIGKTHRPRWQRLIYGSLIDELLEQSNDIDVYVIRGEEERSVAPPQRLQGVKVEKWPYVISSMYVVISALLASGLRFFQIADAEANTVMIFLAAVAWSAFVYGRGPAILASVLAVFVFDFLFVPPQWTFAVSDVQYLVTFAVMLAIGLVISTLTSRLRSQVESTRRRERRTAALYELGKQLSSLYGNVFLANAATSKIAEMLGGEVAIYLQARRGEIDLVSGHESAIAKHSVSLAVAQWVVNHDQIAGAGTNTLPNAVALFVPLTASQRTLGAIAVRITDIQRLLDPDIRMLTETAASQLALALERDQLAIEATEARVQAEAEQVRSSLLSSVSHDLKTPLAAIAGASSSLLRATILDDETRVQLLQSIADEAARLNRLLENILQMSKLEAGAATPNTQWHVLEEIVGSALHRTQKELAQHSVDIVLPAALPLIFVDGLLMEQVLVNVFENAARYTPPGTRITIRAALDGRAIRISITDNGPGLTVGSEQRIFEKFFRATPSNDGGSGLGLAICKAIVRAHGGEISAAHAPDGGAEFVIRLPLPKDIPTVRIE